MDYRMLHKKFWTDEFVDGLNGEQKFFFIYLLTGQYANAAGIYRLPLRQAALDCAYTLEAVREHLDFFEAAGKIRYSKISNEVAIKNWVRYNVNASPKLRKHIAGILNEVKDKALIEYVYGNDTISIPYQSSEAEQTPDNVAKPKKWRDLATPEAIMEEIARRKAL